MSSEDLATPLSNWAVQSQTITVNQDGLPPEMERVKVRDSVAIEGGPLHRYLRLRVTQSDNG